MKSNENNQPLRDARLAYWFPGIPNDFQRWPEEEKQAWEGAIERLQAEELLRFGDLGRLDHRRLYQLVFEATGDRRLAHQTKMQAYEQELIDKTLVE